MGEGSACGRDRKDPAEPAERKDRFYRKPQINLLFIINVRMGTEFMGMYAQNDINKIDEFGEAIKKFVK